MRRSYEVLETYGDTILKLAATLLAYNVYKNDDTSGEGEIENAKVVFVTNFNTWRVGYFKLHTHRYVRLCRDPEAYQWTLPFSSLKD